MGRAHGRALLGLALAGAAVSIYLTYVHYRLLQEPEWQSACEINTVVSCAAALMSPYGSVAGVPVAFLALCFYAAAATIAGSAMRIGRRGRPRSPAAVLFCMSVFSVLLSVALAMVSALVIGAFCAFCALLYAINLSMLGVTCSALRASMEGLREAVFAERRYWRHHQRRGWIGPILLAGTVSAVMLLSKTYRPEPASACCDAVAELSSSDPIELVVFIDFQCSHCQELDRSLRPFRTKSRLKTTLRHYPLDGACNSDVNRSRHPNACLQARAAICARTEGSADEFTDLLFDTGETDQQGLADIAVSLGLDQNRFTSCLAAEETTRALEASIAAARAKGVKGTPTLFLNGRKHAGRLTKADLTCLQRALHE